MKSAAVVTGWVIQTHTECDPLVAGTVAPKPWFGPAPFTKSGASEFGRLDGIAVHRASISTATGTLVDSADGQDAQPVTVTPPAVGSTLDSTAMDSGAGETVTVWHPRFTAPVPLVA